MSKVEKDEERIESLSVYLEELWGMDSDDAIRAARQVYAWFDGEGILKP